MLSVDLTGASWDVLKETGCLGGLSCEIMSLKGIFLPVACIRITTLAEFAPLDRFCARPARNAVPSRAAALIAHHSFITPVWL